MYEVTVRGWFAAAHQLRLTDGELEPLHGHNWNVALTWVGPRLDAMDVLADFTVLRRRLDELLATLHDRNLNELPPFREVNPSAERVAHYVASRMADAAGGAARLACVEIEEAPGCVARFRPD